MGFNPLEPLKRWAWDIALNKVLKKGVQMLIAWLMAMGLNNYGVDVDPEKLAMSLFLLLEPLRNWLKQKYGLAAI